MKKLSFILYLFISLFIVKSYFFTQEIYEGDVFYLEPQLRNSVNLPMTNNKNLEPGAEFSAGFFISDLPLKKFRFGLLGGYSFLTLDSVSSLRMPFMQFNLGYSIMVKNWFSINPDPGIRIAWIINDNIQKTTAEICLGTTLDLHLLDRNFLFLFTNFSIPFHLEGPIFNFSAGLGIKKSFPIMLPVIEARAKFNIKLSRFSPDNDGIDDILKIHIKTKSSRSVKNWQLVILDPKGNKFYQQSGQGAPPEILEWDGKALNGELVQSASDYLLKLEMTDLVRRKIYFNKTIVIDILVIKDRDKYKIRIPSITFPANSADLKKLAKEYIENNTKILKRLAELFAKFPDYKIRIEGHANSLRWQDPEKAKHEQEKILVPLSLRRAEAVKQELVHFGIDEKRITVAGIGAKENLVPFSDLQNNWKNRRVDFILIKMKNK